MRRTTDETTYRKSVLMQGKSLLIVMVAGTLALAVLGACRAACAASVPDHEWLVMNCRKLAREGRAQEAAEQAERVIKQSEDIIQSSPTGDKAAQAYLDMALMYSAYGKRDFAKADEVFKEAIEKYADHALLPAMRYYYAKNMVWGFRAERLDEALDARVAASRTQFPYEKDEAKVESPTRASAGERRGEWEQLSANARQVFARIAERPDEITQERCDHLGIDRATEERARQETIKHGLVRLAGKAWSGTCFYELTAKGRELAKKVGLRVTTLGPGAGPVHEYCVREAEKSLAAGLGGVAFKRKGIVFDDVRPDSLVMGRGQQGFRAPLQVCCSKNYDYEARRLKTLAEAPGVDAVVSVCATKTGLRALARKLAELCGGAIPARIVVCGIEECVKAKIDWKARLGAAWEV